MEHRHTSVPKSVQLQTETERFLTCEKVPKNQTDSGFRIQESGVRTASCSENHRRLLFILNSSSFSHSLLSSFFFSSFFFRFPLRKKQQAQTRNYFVSDWLTDSCDVTQCSRDWLSASSVHVCNFSPAVEKQRPPKSRSRSMFRTRHELLHVHRPNSPVVVPLRDVDTSGNTVLSDRPRLMI